LLKQIRQLHLYLGTLFAPAIIFFALTGALQTLGLHENKDAPAWIAKLSRIHKDQTVAQPHKPRASPPPAVSPPIAARAGAKGEESAGARRPSPWPLKIFVVCMAIGLITTTLLGIYMSFKYNRDRRIVWGLLIVGIALPLLLLYL
jgi:hypothetical protein